MAERFSVDVLRPLDLLSVRFEFFNLSLPSDGMAPLRLRRDSDDEAAFVVAHFPPQHVVERRFRLDEDVDPPVPARVAGPTRLAFRVPDGVSEVPFTLEALLGWKEWDPALVPAALPRGTTFADGEPRPEVRAPGPTETAIELPYRLILSPDPFGGWAHSLSPVSHHGRTELWHTRLAVRRSNPAGEHSLDELTPEHRDVRAVWSPDVVEQRQEFDVLPKPDQRRQIVRLSSDFSLVGQDGRPYVPRPIAVDRLMLSSTGGWLRSRGSWELPRPQGDGFDVTEWIHRATQGRDHYVRIVTEGVLFPFGHRAARIDITERQVDAIPGNVAVLRARSYIVVRQPERDYESRPGEERLPFRFQGREMPFTSLRVLTESSEIDEEPIIDDDAYWVMMPPGSGPPPGRHLPFHLVGTDRAGNDNDFHAALIFVSLKILEPSGTRDGDLGRIAEAYRSANDPTTGMPRRRIVPQGRPIALAPPADPSAPGDTAVSASVLEFEPQLTEGEEAGARDQPPFLPSLARAFVRLPAVEQLTGGSESVEVELAKSYLHFGLADTQNNAAQLFAEVRTSLPVELPPERAGAIASPDLSVNGLSRHLGPVGGKLDDLAQGRFPSDFFLGGARLLGAVSLADVIAEDFTPAQFPKMLTRKTPTSEVTILDWAPRVVPNQALQPRAGRPISLTVRSEIDQPFGGGPPTARTTATLRDFVFNFLRIIEVRFDSLTFSSEAGRKPDVSAELDRGEGVAFLGPLRFLNTLRRFIPPDGFLDPPAVDISPVGINVGYSLPLPPVAVGVFALENVRLGASLHLPFTDGAARVRFTFAERHERFVLTVSGLGGGGFFGLAVGLDGIEMIEAALEFGAAVSMDFGVASGGVHIMAGIYFRFEPKNNDTEVTGYVRCGGELEVLGVISVSVEFFLGLSYRSGPDRIEGEATLVIKVEVLFFSESVELTVRRSFVNAAADPPFGDIMTEDDWAEYADAFAA